ncbi:MAG: sigma-70 family RNA polymerase sigma factor [Chitinophagales bacterium]|nr:sigma-70 family RNA polymerase sigma factor [Chitinophagales bacterium]
MEEQQRIEAAQRDPQQFRYFYDKHYKEIFLFIYRRTDDENLTADITSQVFLKAMQSIDRYMYRGIPFSAWLFRIASNEITQYFRDQQKVRIVSLENANVDQLLEEDNSIQSQKRESLFASIKKLPALDLELIEMRFFEKRPFKEIGDIKGITENHAKVKIHRILERIRNLITVEI